MDRHRYSDDDGQLSSDDNMKADDVMEEKETTRTAVAGDDAANEAVA